MALGKTVRRHREAQGLTQAQLSDRTGGVVSQGAISALEKRDSKSSEFTAMLAQALGLTVNDLITDVPPNYGVQQYGAPYNVSSGPDIRGHVPLISWVQAGQWNEVQDILHVGDGEIIHTTYKARRHTYALRVNGDSMEPKFPNGCTIIVEPEETPIHSSFVVVRQNGDTEATFKQLVIDGGKSFLKPINPRYPIMELRDDAVFCGVVKKMEMDV